MRDWRTQGQLQGLEDPGRQPASVHRVLDDDQNVIVVPSKMLPRRQYKIGKKKRISITRAFCQCMPPTNDLFVNLRLWHREHPVGIYLLRGKPGRYQSFFNDRFHLRFCPESFHDHLRVSAPRVDRSVYQYAHNLRQGNTKSVLIDNLA